LKAASVYKQLVGSGCQGTNGHVSGISLQQRSQSNHTSLQQQQQQQQQQQREKHIGLCYHDSKSLVCMEFNLTN